MLQFRLKRAIIRSDTETQRVSIVCPDGAQYVIQFTTDDDHFHEFETYLLWNAMHYSDFRDEERTLIVIREVEHYALMQDIENFEGKYLVGSPSQPQSISRASLTRSMEKATVTFGISFIMQSRYGDASPSRHSVS